MASNVGNVQITLDTRVLDRVRNGLKNKAEALLDKVARDIEHDAKQQARVDTGALRNSIHVKDGNLERTIADGVEYGVYNEFGTVHMASQPFLGPAVEHNRRSFLDAWKELFE